MQHRRQWTKSRLYVMTDEECKTILAVITAPNHGEARATAERKAREQNLTRRDYRIFEGIVA